MASGVYEISNMVNEKCYIGSAIDIDSRFNMHKRDLNHRKHHNRHLQRAWNKYGEKSFDFHVVLMCSEDNLLFYEQRIIDAKKATNINNGYNISPTAGSQLGFKHSQKTKEHWSRTRKGRSPWNKGLKNPYTISDETREKLSKVRMGHPTSDETRQKISKALMGHSVSKETRKKISKTSIGRSHPYKGKTGMFTHSEETKKKMSMSHKGKVVSEETRRNMSIAAKNRKHKKIMEKSDVS